jgi:hypothetical protein
LGGVHGAVHHHVPPWTARHPERPRDGLRQQPVRDQRRLPLCDNPEDMTTQTRDPTREYNICVALASSSSDPEPAPRHRATDTQQRARLDELTKARRRLNEELANLHRELGHDPKPRNRQPAPLPAPQMVPVQEQPREGNDKRQECRLAVEQPRARAPTPLSRGRTRDNDRRANKGANVDANANGDAPPLFR